MDRLKFNGWMIKEGFRETELVLSQERSWRNGTAVKRLGQVNFQGKSVFFGGTMRWGGVNEK